LVSIKELYYDAQPTKSQDKYVCLVENQGHPKPETFTFITTQKTSCNIKIIFVSLVAETTRLCHLSAWPEKRSVLH